MIFELLIFWLKIEIVKKSIVLINWILNDLILICVLSLIENSMLNLKKISHKYDWTDCYNWKSRIKIRNWLIMCRNIMFVMFVNVTLNMRKNFFVRWIVRNLINYDINWLISIRDHVQKSKILQYNWKNLIRIDEYLTQQIFIELNFVRQHNYNRVFINRIEKIEFFNFIVNNFDKFFNCFIIVICIFVAFEIDLFFFSIDFSCHAT